MEAKIGELNGLNSFANRIRGVKNMCLHTPVRTEAKLILTVLAIVSLNKS